MPNWVYSYVKITGAEEEIAKFRELAGKEAPSDIKDGQLIYEAKDLSFWNFIEPEDKEQYFLENWYDWNIEHWGTKWDACQTERCLQEKNELHYRFETAWSIPEPVFRVMAEKFSGLTFEFYCEEEQGWGAEYKAENGNLALTKEWDVPDSHADYVSLDKEDSCICSWEGDPDDWYSDCPRPEEDFEVVLNQVIKVRAKNAEHAWEISNKLVEDFVKSLGTQGIEPTSDSKTWVERNNERIYPTLT